MNRLQSDRIGIITDILIKGTMNIEEIKSTREKIVILEKLFAVLVFKYGINELNI